MQRKQVGQYSNEAKSRHGYLETDPTGRYGRFDEVLGKGAVKTVYKAIDELLGMEVAWNQVILNEVLQKPEDLERLYSEVHLLSTLNHDSIMHFYTSWIDIQQKTFNFITEMFTSGTLREYKKKYRHVNIQAIKNWARQILQGLVYLHSHEPPVIHRDLKCDNIFVNGHLGQVKIGDLGLAAILRDSKSAHSVIGTPEFMAPELYEEDYNELVDVYSFGMCLLEMLTSEYPYSECANPAQIYKKVTSVNLSYESVLYLLIIQSDLHEFFAVQGKLPAAFYRIQDFEAQIFIGKCLVAASKRLSAKEILLDPFLALDGDEMPILSRLRSQKPFLNEREMEKLQLNDDPRTDMTITGKLNPDDTIFLKVQIANNDGSSRNIYFPFDIINDTPMDVAMEMVKELEIDDWGPQEIAEMIDGEISALVPNRKKWDFPDIDEIFDHQKDDGQDNPSRFPSSCSSSLASISELTTHFLQESECQLEINVAGEGLFEDTSSQSSSHSGSYSNFKYISRDDHKCKMSSTSKGKHPITRIPRVTRFSPQDNSSSHIGQAIARAAYKHCNVLPEKQYKACSSKGRRLMDSRILTRNQSLIDVRSQLLQRSLVEEVNKRRIFKTVGAVEKIGFHTPPDVSKSALQRTWNGRS